LVSKVLYDLGSEYVEAVNGDFRRRCNPHPHVFSDRVLRPAIRGITTLHSYMGYRTCLLPCFTIGYASRAMIDAYTRCANISTQRFRWVGPGARREKSLPCGQKQGVRLPG